MDEYLKDQLLQAIANNSKSLQPISLTPDYIHKFKADQLSESDLPIELLF